MKSSAIRTVGFIAIAIFLSKVLGLGRDIIFGWHYGTGTLSDAFRIANRIPILFFDLTLGAAVVSTFIPVFAGYIQKGDRKSAFRFANSFLNLVLLISAAFCLIAIAFRGAFVRLMAQGVPAETAILAQNLLIIMLPMTLFTALAYVFVGILQTLDEFNVPAIISLVANSAVIFYLAVLDKRFGIYGLAVAMLIGWSLQVLVQVPSLIKKGYRYSFKIHLKDKGFRDVARLCLPILASSWVQPICVAIIMRYAAYLGTGMVTALEQANQLYLVAAGVLTFAITNYIFPKLAKLGEDDHGQVVVLRKSLKAVTLLIVPIAIGLAVLAEPAIRLVYMRGEFDERSVQMMVAGLWGFCPGMLALAVNDVLNKGFYARKNGKVPMIAAGVGIIVGYVSARVLGGTATGLTMSTAIALNVIAVILLWCMHREIGLFDREINMIKGFLVKGWQNSFVGRIDLAKAWEQSGIGRFLAEDRCDAEKSVFARALNDILGRVRADSWILSMTCLFKPIWGVFALVFLVPFVPTMVCVGISLVTFVSFIAHVVTGRIKFRRLDALSVAIFVFMDILGVFAIFSLAMASSIKVWLIYGAFISAFFVIVNVIDTRRKLMSLVGTFVTAGGIVATYGVYQRFFGNINAATWMDLEMFGELGSRVYSTFENPNVLGTYFLMLIPLAAAMVLACQSWRFKVFFAGIFAISCFCMVLTQSRGCWLALMMSAAVFIIMTERRLIWLFVIGIIAAPFVLPAAIMDRFLSIGNVADSSTSYRVFIWLGTVNMLRDFWLWGIGLGSAAYNQIYPFYAYSNIVAPHAHNIYLQLMCETGIVGLGAFIAVLWIAVRKYLSNVNVLTVAVFAGLLGFLLQGIFDYTWYNYRVFLIFWMFIAIGAVASRGDVND